MIGLASEVYYQISGLLEYNNISSMYFHDYILLAFIPILLSTTAIIYPQQWRA